MITWVELVIKVTPGGSPDTIALFALLIEYLIGVIWLKSQTICSSIDPASRVRLEVPTTVILPVIDTC